MSKIDNNEVWDEVKAGKFKGYSIEARFDGFEQLQSKNKETMEEQIIKELNAVLSSQKVELSLTDDIKEQYKMIETRKNEGFKLLAETEDKFKSMIDRLGLLESIADKGIQMSKELGVEPKEFIVAKNVAVENKKKFSKYLNLL